MNIEAQVHAALLAPVVLLLAGCASPADCCSEVARASDTPAVLGSVSERLALALSDADDAFTRGDRGRLADALRRFDELGGRPMDGDASDLRRWRQAANQTPPMRGRTLGPGYRSGQLSPGDSEQIEQVFLSGKRASVALSAPGAARLTLEVQDRGDKAICGKEGNPSHCQWVPVFTARYRIRIANPGPAAVRYYLVVE